MANSSTPRVYGLDAICAAALQPGGEEAAQFARRLFSRVSDKDLAAAPVEQRAAAAVSLLSFARRRLPGVAKIRIFNPALDDHGFESRHTIVQIVNDDMPFLVDSITNEFNRREISVHLLAHPVLAARRDLDGDLVGIALETGERARAESMMHIEIDRQTDPVLLDEIAAALTRVLAEVRVAVDDWRAMRRACLDAILDLAPGHAPNLAEYEDFLRWLEANHFTFLGHRRYRYVEDASQPAGLRYEIVPGSALGILRRDEVRLFEPGVGSGEAMARFARGPHNILVVKTDRQSLVHRSGAMDCVIVKTCDADGRVTGEHRLVGLFTSAAYHAPVHDVPLLRGRIESLLRRSGFDRHGHDGKTLLAILDAYPRDELFQVDENTLYDHVLGILQLQERRRVALFSRLDTVGRFATALVFVPRERFDETLSARFAAILEKTWNGHVTSVASSVGSNSALVQSLYTLKLHAPEQAGPDLVELERALMDAATSWNDRLRAALQAKFGEAEGRAAARRWRDWFPAVYRETFDAAQALIDIELLQTIVDGAGFGVQVGRRSGMPAHRFALRLFHPRKPIALSDILPLAENLGLRVISEAPFLLRKEGGDDQSHGVAMQVLRVETADKSPVDLDAAGPRFVEAIEKLRAGTLENDGLNRLVLGAGLAWREVAIVRAYAKYLRQAGIPFSQEYMERALAAYPKVARLVVDLFRARFDPSLGDAAADDRGNRIAAIETEFATALEAVGTLDEDRILRRFHNAVLCTLRTNYWQSGGTKDWISFKIDSRAIDELPAPRPLVEIFVYSPRMEGIHLRGGRVARGGIRWSDRREDFRTEILGLMKTQMVKNAVIVPVGSKGGFYVKQPPAGGTREQIQAEGIACYQTLIRGLLDITDNYAGGSVVPPADVVRHDADDPYLVVAADKGTATFSDIANALARDYGFWLDDAFASGGSAGYDHKKMGITARGAWESVKRHFRELGQDIQETPFTVAGVGDMSGDVFGNGMLLSPHIKLVAAFDHRHIFIDPSPDPATSFAERQRLFALPRSSWMDYDQSLLSAGGAIIDRAAKSVTLSPEARAVLGIEAPAMAPLDLLRAILTAPVDLLYFGGIGTYVKASSETNADAGDRANDSVRIDAAQVRARVIGEGANLGFTQRGRVEAALGGRRINTDALDNSAGVDTSDHEVNIKIATGGAIASGALTVEARDPLLFSMTDEVATLVLRHNYQQSQAISVAEGQAAEEHDRLERFMRALERKGRLDRAVEYLPDSAAMRVRAQNRQPLTRPELCVLLAYAKIDLHEEILASDLPDDPRLEEELLRYFPAPLQEKHAAALRGHRLRREITALQVVNSLVNRCGPTFVHTVAQRTGATAAPIAQAFTVVRDAWKLRDLWVDIEALDGQLRAEAQLRMLVASQRFVVRTVQWTLRRLPQPLDTTAATAQLGRAVAELGDLRADLIGEAEGAALGERSAAFEAMGAPADLARRAAALETLSAAGDLALAAEANGCSIGNAARLYFKLGERLSLALLANAAQKLPRDGLWPSQAALALQDELAALHADLLRSALRAGGGNDCNPEAALAAWSEPRKLALERVDRLLKEDLAAAGTIDLAMLSVATAELRTLV
ncbi:NAD-glutamate dehydrogenase [Reyranella sp. MMS21-HV4-11]|uniref:NAD-glutamate dehydrogenase n=1 Tax=Reyranella humidisoli TaxID=2849149 RepID=A0ABS6IHT2_9HYPH|nr:NAD-glutamate dehydrogenase [Reyranella sp. MMS21-HV4-11]MBU8873439.1 NAD-glutamate dehydrogenase [Reyranella sp. MMS21-HV4-11]